MENIEVVYPPKVGTNPSINISQQRAAYHNI